MELVEEKNVRGKKGTPYINYMEAVEPHIENIKYKIRNSKEGEILVLCEEMAEVMGKEFIKKKHRTIYLGLKHILAKYDINTGFGTDKKNKYIVLRFK